VCGCAAYPAGLSGPANAPASLAHGARPVLPPSDFASFLTDFPDEWALAGDGLAVVDGAGGEAGVAVIVGNVGRLQGGIPLLRRPRPTTAGWMPRSSPRGWGDWIALAAQVILRRQRASRVIGVHGEQPWELDGEVMGGTRRLAITVQPGALLLRGPVPVAL
jgi:hypothetical protein